MEPGSPEADEVSGKSSQALIARRSMSTSQLIIVTVLSLAVIALLMVRQQQTN